MVDKKHIDKQLKRLGFNPKGWGRTEVNELHNILLPDEEIYELVNGFYEGGFALLVATDVRVLLIDKKPMNYLTVEDLRFDMINEMDYNHRLIGANISIATGNKNLKFTSVNQPRLRKLIGHVQHCMAESKKQQSNHAEDQKSHLKQINEQLQAYLAAQHQYTQQLQAFQQAQQAGQPAPPPPEPVQPSNELKDFLFAQNLLAQYQGQVASPPAPAQLAPQPTEPALPEPPQAPAASPLPNNNSSEINDLYAEGMREIYGKHQVEPPRHLIPGIPGIPNPLELNAMKIAYSKLPMALRNRKFGRPSFHAHSAAETSPQVAESLSG
jgi:hypothetical protein